MSAIIPNYDQKSKGKLPKWLDREALSKAASEEVTTRNNIMTKTASETGNRIISFYGCSCGKKWSADHPHFAKQIKTASVEGAKKVTLTCPVCANNVFALNQVGRNNNQHTVQHSAAFAGDGETDLSKKATYNTFVDRHVVTKVLQALQNHGSKMGMTLARARYLTGEHVKEAGFDYPILGKIEAAIEWIYGKNQKHTVTANVSIDAAGKFTLPTVFKDANHKEYPFTKEAVEQIERHVKPKSMPPQRRKTDIPMFRPIDISRFRAVASKDGGSEDNVVEADGVSKIISADLNADRFDPKVPAEADKNQSPSAESDEKIDEEKKEEKFASIDSLVDELIGG
jgi:hypothetical protein